MGRYRDRERHIWALVAFIGRYGHQPAGWQLTRSLDELEVIAKEIGKLLHEEHRVPGEGED